MDKWEGFKAFYARSSSAETVRYDVNIHYDILRYFFACLKKTISSLYSQFTFFYGTFLYLMIEKKQMPWLVLEGKHQFRNFQ